jgi:hypothetical protein
VEIRGNVLMHASRHRDLAGRYATDGMIQLLTERSYSFMLTVEQVIVRIMEKM